MHHIPGVAIGDCGEQLLHHNGCLDFREVFHLDNAIKEFSARAEFRDEVHIGMVLIELIQFDYIGMIEMRENVDFTGNGGIAEVCAAFFGDALQGSFLLRDRVEHQLHFSKRTLPQHLLHMIPFVESALSFDHKPTRLYADVLARWLLYRLPRLTTL